MSLKAAAKGKWRRAVTTRRKATQEGKELPWGQAVEEFCQLL